MFEYMLTMIGYLIVWFSMMVYGLSVFRIKIRPNLYPILISVFILTQLATVIQIEKKTFLIPILFPILFCLCYWYFLKIKPLYSTVIGITSYLTSILVEVIYNYLVGFLSIYEETLPYMLIGSIVLSWIMLTLSYILTKNRIGFSFITISTFKVISSKERTKFKIIILVCMALLAPCSLFYSLLRNYLLIFMTFIIVALIIVYYTHFKHELED
jgi:hypothetical protein